MKVAIIHDVFIEFGGAERVLIALLKMYPSCDVFIPLLSDNHQSIVKNLTKGKIITSWFDHFPFFQSASIILKPFLYWYWETLDLNGYDLVISSSHSFSSKSVLTSPKTLHVSYIHTPPRYLYTEYNETRIIKKPFFKFMLAPLMTWLRTQDYLGAQRPDILVANSKTTQARIKKYYRRKSIVIYPPVIMPKKVTLNQPKRYFLCVSRLAKQKGTDLAIRACNELKLPLWIVGAGSEEQYLKSIAGPTIEFKGFVADEKMMDIYAHAKALIYCSKEEDFGMVPVEAMAHGVPVIGFKSGGVAETVEGSKSGILFELFSIESLIASIKQFNSNGVSNSNCLTVAKKFSEKKFQEKIKKIINNTL